MGFSLSGLLSLFRLSGLSVALRSGRGDSFSLNRFLKFGFGWDTSMRLVIAVGTLVAFLKSEVSLYFYPPFCDSLFWLSVALRSGRGGSF
jgi:hypothetical protein